MKTQSIALAIACAVTFAFVPSCATTPSHHAASARSSAGQIARDSRSALHSLYAQNPGARALGKRARAVLVFPSIVKGGFVIGAEGGNGAMFRNGEITGYYQTVAASYGLQAGVQEFGYALFLMDDQAYRNFLRSDGWEIGGSPSVVVVDMGMATSLSTTTARRGTYAFFFDQRGLMGGLSLQGTKVTRIHPGR